MLSYVYVKNLNGKPTFIKHHLLGQGVKILQTPPEKYRTS